MEKEQKQTVCLVGKKVILRPRRKELDLENCWRWINDPEIAPFIQIVPPIDFKSEEEWFDGVGKDGNNKVFVIVDKENGKPIGNMGLHNIDWVHRFAVSGALIGEKEYWGKGYGTDAKMLLLNYAFNTLGLRKVCSSVYDFNSRSLDYNKHCGYKVEGVLRKQRFKAGKYCDEILVAVFREDWEPIWDLYQKTGKVK